MNNRKDLNKFLKNTGYGYKKKSMAESLIPKRIQIRGVKKNQGMQNTLDAVRKKGYPGANFIK